MKELPKIKIFVSHHKPGYIYEDDIYTPIQVGKKNSKIDLGILGDDTGDNISEKNSNYAELTAQYRVWKNYDLSDVDYIGFCHYRRYMTYCYKPNMLNYLFAKNPYSPTESKSKRIRKIKSRKEGNCLFDFDKILLYQNKLNLEKYISKEKLDLYTVKKEIILAGCIKRFLGIKSKQFNSYGFLGGHDKFKDTAKDIFLQIYPDYKNIIEQVNKTFDIRVPLHRHIYIMKKELYFEYMERLFKYLFVIEKYISDNNIDTKKYFLGDTRFIGILSEPLINYWKCYKEKYNNLHSKSSSNIILFN